MNCLRGLAACLGEAFPGGIFAGMAVLMEACLHARSRLPEAAAAAMASPALLFRLKTSLEPADPPQVPQDLQASPRTSLPWRLQAQARLLLDVCFSGWLLRCVYVQPSAGVAINVPVPVVLDGSKLSWHIPPVMPNSGAAAARSVLCSLEELDRRRSACRAFRSKTGIRPQVHPRVPFEVRLRHGGCWSVRLP